MEGLVNLVYHIAIPQGTLPWQPIEVAKSAFFFIVTLPFQRLQYRNSDFQKIKWHELICIA